MQGGKDVAPAPPAKLWKKRNAEARVKREYKTASEVRCAELGGSASFCVSVPVIHLHLAHQLGCQLS